MVVNKKVIVTVLLATVILLVLIKPWEVQARGVAKVADLPVPVYRSCSALGDDGNIYVFGGETSDGASSQVVRFNPASAAVDVVADLGDGFKGGWAVNYNGKIYAGGGYYGSQPTPYIFIFDPADNSITTTAPASTMNVYCDRGKGNIGAFVDSGKIYVFWGVRLSSFQTTVKIYDPATNDTTTTNKPPSSWGASESSVQYYSLDSYNGLGYIAGYYNSTGSSTGILKYDPVTDTITQEITDFPYMAGAPACFDADGKLYLFGGRKITSPEEMISDIIKYDPVSKTFANVGSLPQARGYSTAALANNGKIYLFGGCDSLTAGESITTDILEIDPVILTSPPEDFTLSGSVDSGDVCLTWPEAEGATGYTVERSEDGVNYTQLAQPEGNSYTDPGPAAGTYYYRVIAENSFGSTTSNVITLTVLPPPVLSVSLDDNNSVLSWTYSDGAASYIIDRSTDGSNFSQLVETDQQGYTDSELAPGSYYYRVKAKNASGTSGPSNMVSVFIESSSLAAYWNGGCVTVEWDRGGMGIPGDDFQLWRMDSNTNRWVPAWDIINIDAFTFNDTRVLQGVNYKYAVRSRGGLDTFYEWQTIADSGWATGDRPLPAPGGLQVLSTTDTTAEITWALVDGAGSYRVQTSTDEGDTWQESTVSGPPTTVPRPCMARVKAGTHTGSQWSGVLRVE